MATLNFIMPAELKHSLCDRTEKENKVVHSWEPSGQTRAIVGDRIAVECICRHCNVREWTDAGEWMWDNRQHYNGLSVLPFNGGTYQQAPFEDCSREKFEVMMGTLQGVDLTKIVEEDDNTDLKGEVACAGGACEIT